MLTLSLENRTDVYDSYGGSTYVLSDIHQELCLLARVREDHNALTAKLSRSEGTDKQFGSCQIP